MSSKVGEVRERYMKIGNDMKIIGDMTLPAFLELEGICRGVVCAQSGRDESHYSYCGILQRANGELLEFSGIGFQA